MELHTLGVDGGYTQADIKEVARAFTGWTILTRAAIGVLLPVWQRHRRPAFDAFGAPCGLPEDAESGTFFL
jgi:hypothetical protein